MGTSTSSGPRTDSSDRVARRMHPPSWRDGRLVTGVLLVVGAMFVGGLALSHFDDSVQVVRSKAALVPGDTVGKDDLEVVKVRLDSAQGQYFAGGELPTGTVLREVRPGELVPRSAIGAKAAGDLRTITLPATGNSSAVLVRGSVVDVWVADAAGEPGAARSYDPPRKVVSGATVQRVPEGRSGLSVSTGAEQVSLLVPQSEIEALITAVNNEAKVTLVPAAGTRLRG